MRARHFKFTELVDDLLSGEELPFIIFMTEDPQHFTEDNINEMLRKTTPEISKPDHECNSKALVLRALMLEKNLGVPKDLLAAAAMYARAAKLNDPTAMACWAHKLEKRNLNQAIELYQGAIELEGSLAMSCRAYLYQQPSDQAKAIDLYERAIKASNPLAMYNLAYLYARMPNADDVKFREASRLYRKAYPISGSKLKAGIFKSLQQLAQRTQDIETHYNIALIGEKLERHQKVRLLLSLDSYSLISLMCKDNLLSNLEKFEYLSIVQQICKNEELTLSQRIKQTHGLEFILPAPLRTFLTSFHEWEHDYALPLRTFLVNLKGDINRAMDVAWHNHIKLWAAIPTPLLKLKDLLMNAETNVTHASNAFILSTALEAEELLNLTLGQGATENSGTLFANKWLSKLESFKVECFIEHLKAKEAKAAKESRTFVKPISIKR